MLCAKLFGGENKLMEPTEYIKNWIMAKVAKYLKQLGIVNENDMPTVIVTTREYKAFCQQQNEKLRDAGLRIANGGDSYLYLGTCLPNRLGIFINVKYQDTFEGLENTIIHELIHYRFGLHHRSERTRKLYDKLIESILKGKTDHDIVDTEKLIEQKQNNKDGTKYYIFKKIKKTKKVYETIKIQNCASVTRTSIQPLLYVQVEGKPEIAAIATNLKTLLKRSRERIRSALYNNNEEVDIILNYDKKIDYNAMLLEVYEWTLL